MNFVLQLNTVGQAGPVVDNTGRKTVGERQQLTTAALLLARDMVTGPLTVGTGTTPTTMNTVNTLTIASGDDARSDGGSSKSLQILQRLEINNSQQEVAVPAGAVAASFSTQAKTMLTYPVAKGAREVQKMIAGSQTNTTQVLTTRVISQKLPSSTSSHQAQTVPVTLDIPSHATHASVNSTSLPSPGGGVVYPLQVCTQGSQSARSQVAISELIHSKQQQQQLTTANNVQTTLHHKLQQVSTQHIVSAAAAVKAITTAATTVSNVQRIHMKTSPNIVTQSPQTVNLHKVKTVTNVITNKSATMQRNSLPKLQGVQQKSQLLTGQTMNQFATNQTNTNTQKVQQGNSAVENKTISSNNLQQQKMQAVNMVNAQRVSPQSVCNNQKILSSQLLSGHPNNKHQQQQQQQYPGNQQTTQQQGIQKLQGSQKTTLAVARQQQQQSNASMNNVPKSCSGTVVGIHKVQQQTQIPQRSITQKSQALATIGTVNRAQSVCKSNSMPNVSKIPQNSNMLTIGKHPQQQMVSQQQQQLQSSMQLQQQLLQASQQQPVAVQKSQQQQQQPATNANNLQTQRSHSITNVHQKVIAANQRTQAIMNSKVQQQQQSQQQQQMVMRVGIPTKGQALQNSQSANLKTISQKLANSVKAVNSQNTSQQSTQRNINAQPIKLVQQQQQQQQQNNMVSLQNSQQDARMKQPGCIKTIPPQKPVQRNHNQKISGSGGIKTSLNTNVTALKGQSPATSTVTQKASIKTLLPQQTIASNIMTHKNSPIKIQQQAIQQKQLIMAPQYAQQIRHHAGQIKTLLPVMATEAHKETENKNDTEFLTSKEEGQSAPKSPVRRMPLPYECLQFVLQDHNYGAPPPRTPPPPSPPPHPKQQPINGAGSSTATSQHPYVFCPVVSSTNTEDDAASAISSEAGREVEPEGEETETAPEGEGDDEDSVTRCICDFEHDDGYMICCDRCLVWQHVDCMGIDRSNIPDEYLCERCRPRRVDRQRARALQMRKREELLNSDTSSDTSSTSSADTDVGVNAPQKKRPLQQQQQTVPRRSKSDTPAQVRRLNNNNNNNNNNNVAKRQRRDSHPRQSSTVRKKETVVKRGPGKRKAKRRMSLEDKEEDAQDAWGSPNMVPLRQWIERYEEAVTNHYSPELRARISSIKVNGTHNDLRQNNMNVIATGKCRLNIHSNNLRFLVATMYLPPNTPVVELRGKYMLSTQHRSQHPQGRQHAQRPGPFVFFYRLPRDGTEVCVDTRTYGNDARFVRRSCKPNAEVKHCIEKGTLHLYIVTTSAIEKNAEITIKHEQHDLLLSPNSNSPILPVACACNNPRECQIVTASQLSRRGSNGSLIENADGRERRRRGRRNTVCEETDPAPAVPSTSATQVTPTATSISTVTTPSPRRTVTTGITTIATRQVPKDEPPAIVQQPETPPSLSQSTPPEIKKDKKKMTREERKMEAIMKAFERLEKAEQRKQEVQARNAQRKESSGTHSDNEDNHSTTGQSKSKQANSERPLRRKRRKGRARTTSSSQSQSNRRTRLNSAESDVSSGDESNSMQSPPLLSQTRPPSRDISYSSHLHTPAKDTNDGNNTGSGQGIPTAAGLLLALANSNVPPGPPSSPPLQQPTPVKSPTCDSGASSSSQSSTPSTPLSSACLLVAAAVGPLAPGFKFPKTKKVLMNEWLKESPDPPPPPLPLSQANIMPQISPLPALSSASALQNSMNSALCCNRLTAVSSDFPLPSTVADPSAEFLSQTYAAKSLATLVQAANSVSGICDSPPQQRKQQAASNNNGSCPVSTGSAKKRWLRQAISEECDSPNSRPESPPALSETVAPPKKRRIARESLSSDNYTPPTTPTMLLPEAAPNNNRSLCPIEDDYVEHVQSPIVEQNDERQYETVAVKEETNMDSDELICHNKLSIDIPQSDFYVKRTEKIETLDIIKMETSPIKIEDVTIKDEASPKCEKNDIKSDYNFAALPSDSELFIKNDPGSVKSEVSDHTKKDCFVKKEEEQVITKGTVEIIDQNEPDTEIEGFSSPSWCRCTMESDAILKQRVAEMQLEFSGGIAEIVNITSGNEKSDNEKKLSEEETASKCQEVDGLDENVSIDEFDVEAQMKKITGDDGNDYQEKIDTSSERDKSMDGIEGLMESSKEDSDSEDKDVDEVKYCEPAFKLFNINHEEETSFKELDTKSEQVIITENNVKEVDKDVNHEPSKAKQLSVFTASSEESMFESASPNIEAESTVDPPKIFHSIPPLSERIRKKTADPVTTPKTPSLDFEASIIESTITMETANESKNGEQKSMLSTALRELLEAKLEDESSEVIKNDVDNETTNASQVTQPAKSDSPECNSDTQNSTPALEAQTKEAPAKEEEAKPQEIKRLKDPRTVVPNNMPAPPAFKSDVLPPVKRKVRTLSISEYRKRKQQSSGGSLTESEPSGDTSLADKSGARGRSDSASSGTSSLSSDEEGCKMSHSLDLPGLTTLPLFTSTENDEKKGGEEGTIGWSAAPTLVERQRENLTERLKREFGLFLSDDEEERARKHGLTAEAILKARKASPPNSSVSNTSPGYPLPQLPPQPYIPPPGSAPIRYPQFQSKPAPVPFPSFTLPQSTGQPTYGTVASPASAVGSNNSKQPQQPFLVPQASQAPPGSNPYPPQFVPPVATAVPPVATAVPPVPKFSSTTPPPLPPSSAANPAYSTPGQPQKTFFNHPAPRS